MTATSRFESGDRLRVRLLLAWAALAALVSGCSTPPVRDNVPPSTRAAIVGTAQHMLGHPYRYGGKGPAGFDCSGLAYYSYAHAGIRIPRTVRQQFRHALHVRRLQPGDLLFFRIRGRTISHVGIYIGHGRFIHAPAGGSRVTTASLDTPYWHRRYAGGGRY